MNASESAACSTVGLRANPPSSWYNRSSVAPTDKLLRRGLLDQGHADEVCRAVSW